MPRKRRPLPWTEERDGFHYVYWYDETAKPARTKRVSLGTKDPVEAQKRFAAFLAGGSASLSTGRTAGVTVTAALDDYYREHVSANVVDKQRAENAITHLKSYFGNCLLSEIDIPASRGYADARRMGVVGGGRRRPDAVGSDSTIRRELVVLQAAANHALRWKRITTGETPSIELPREAAREEIWLTQAETQRAIGAATGRLKDFMMVLYYTAARRASIEALTRFQVDLRQGRISLTSPKETANERRSVKRRPVVPIAPEIRPVVERLLEQNAASEYVFGDDRSMYRVFVRHMTAVGLAGKANPHVMRHSRATHLLQSGVDIYSVARLLGDTVATVERVYGHHSVDYLADAINRSTGQ